MALITEDGSGSATAESYLSEADADTYHTTHGASTDWSGASTAVKEVALRMATQYLDAVYALRWKGVRKLSTQRLAWPRSDVEDYDGFAIDTDSLPRMLEEATAEAAVRHITETNGLLPDVDGSGDIKREMVKVGPVQEDISYVGGKKQLKTFSMVESLLRDLIHARGRVDRG